MFRFQRLAPQCVRSMCNRNVPNVKITSRYLSTNMQSEGSALQKAFLNAVKPSSTSSEKDEISGESSSSSSFTATKIEETTESVNTSSDSERYFPDLKSRLKKDEADGENIELPTEKKLNLNPIQQSTKKFTSPPSTSNESASSKVYSFQSPSASVTTPPASFTSQTMEFSQGHIHEFAPKIIVLVLAVVVAMLLTT